MIEKGSFVLVDYTLKTERGDVLETTLEEVAKEHKIGGFFYPKLIIVGSGEVFKQIEDALLGKKEGDEVKAEIPPKDAFGERKGENIKILSVKRFIKQFGEVPEKGKKVRLGNKEGRVESVTQGRVIVDFNHPLAGLTLIFEGKIVKIVSDFNEKILEIIKKRFELKHIEDFKVNFSNGTLTVEIPYEIARLSSSHLAKRAIEYDIRKHIPEINEIVFIERWKRPEEKEAKKKEEKESKKTTKIKKGKAVIKEVATEKKKPE